MMSLDPALLAKVAIAASVALVVLGVVTLLAASNAGKQLAGAATVMLGAAFAVAALRAPQIFVSAAVAVAFAYAALGALILVRLQEAYGDTEIPAIDAVDDDAEGAGKAP